MRISKTVPHGAKHVTHLDLPISEAPMRRGRRPDPVIEFPEPLFTDWIEPTCFQEALCLHMNRHGDSYWRLWRAIVRPGEKLSRHTIQSWGAGDRIPRSIDSFEMLSRMEHRYRLPTGYFRKLLPHQTRAPAGHRLDGIAPAEQRRLAWHLPDDFNDRPAKERGEIIAWVRQHILFGSTDYRRYQAEAMKHRYAIRFPDLTGRRPTKPVVSDDDEARDPDILSVAMDAPPGLAREMADLVAFKTATLTAIGLRRNGVWGEETSSQKIEHLGLMFGALAASPKGVVAGFGLPLTDLSFGLLVFPAVWDWYVQWRERRRGFYTGWEVDMLRLIASLTREETGWMRQTPKLAKRLSPVPHLVSAEDIAEAQQDWISACDTIHAHAMARAKEIERVAQIHRDPFEPILPILEADSPVAEYRKITDEILRTLPDERRYPRRRAEAIRSFLLLRLGLHLGLRQKNLRQLMVCLPGQSPRTERQLEALKRGELRWNERVEGWEVLIPAVAFKNADSSFFAGKSFRLILPDLGDLYRHLSAYIRRHRAALLAEAADPGTLFVKTVKRNSKDAAYDQNTIYEAWRLTIQRYGIWNPYTQRGVIKGLLPHGPHNVRDVLATHILKQTGSYEQASYAIQDTPEMVARHYGRFFPQDKAALAANILNQVWMAA
jgi:hypothetical protein